ncbi:hypothetical protein JOB18_022013 [Solea senegalensis]|uniref:Uncharacterized protein n=1 Tax=Solea senegalensis TaxID=28829 RepID=A0AAV6QI95_SOLSE|nr:hypothetical protein JOB18_022013 [Solea senegalensis]
MVEKLENIPLRNYQQRLISELVSKSIFSFCGRHHLRVVYFCGAEPHLLPMSRAVAVVLLLPEYRQCGKVPEQFVFIWYLEHLKSQSESTPKSAKVIAVEEKNNPGVRDYSGNLVFTLILLLSDDVLSIVELYRMGNEDSNAKPTEPALLGFSALTATCQLHQPQNQEFLEGVVILSSPSPPALSCGGCILKGPPVP